MNFSFLATTHNKHLHLEFEVKRPRTYCNLSSGKALTCKLQCLVVIFN